MGAEATFEGPSCSVLQWGSQQGLLAGTGGPAHVPALETQPRKGVWVQGSPLILLALGRPCGEVSSPAGIEQESPQPTQICHGLLGCWGLAHPSQGG